jgi:hypothetical protein
MSSQSSALRSASSVDDSNRFMSGGQLAATALYVSSMAMRALPGAGARELRFFLRGGWRVSILARFALLFDCVDIGLLAPTGVWSCVSRFRARPDTK